MEEVVTIKLNKWLTLTKELEEFRDKSIALTTDYSNYDYSMGYQQIRFIPGPKADGVILEKLKLIQDENYLVEKELLSAYRKSYSKEVPVKQPEPKSFLQRLKYLFTGKLD